MEEELSEHELEERFYDMVHRSGEHQDNLIEPTPNQNEVERLMANAPKSTVRRYWRTSGETNNHQKVNSPKELPTTSTKPQANSQIQLNTKTQENLQKQPDAETELKEEKNEITAPLPPVEHSQLQEPVPLNASKTIEILDLNNDNPVILESSDEDEVVEVAIPPKPTITIESSDEELEIVNNVLEDNKQKKQQMNKQSPDRAVSASPVPSVVSSVSDDFIRGDCIALNISSRRPDNRSFDFSLHGTDLLDQRTPSKKKKKKRTKEATTSTPISTTDKSVIVIDECFATPKSKAKNKRQKTKAYAAPEKSIPNPDVYDSDSNQSAILPNKSKDSYKVTEKSIPNIDVYESDSNQSEIVKENPKQGNPMEIDSSDSSLDKPSTPKSSKKNESELKNNSEQIPTVDLTGSDSFFTIDTTGINESIVMGNVTGFTESSDYGDDNQSQLNLNDNLSKFCSTKEPEILKSDLDFDNLKGTVCKRRKYSLTTLRAEMEKFYNESWGGEDFNHRELQKTMSRDKNLWVIDPKDRMSSLSRRRNVCSYCQRSGHREDACRLKPPVCYMCGTAGHYEPRCPAKICVNCGSSNYIYSTKCSNCSSWGSLKCVECGQQGHPSSHCPDLWRRYHNTIDNNVPLEKTTQTKKHVQLYCSGCSRRGHLVHTCRCTIPFSGLPINSPYVCVYTPVYPPSNNRRQSGKFSQESTISSVTPNRMVATKRQSKSPTTHESHVNKKRNISVSEDTSAVCNTKSPINTVNQTTDDGNKATKETKNNHLDTSKTVPDTPDFIPLFANNRDGQGQMIQDNEVSDSSDAVTSARIFVPNDVINRLKTKDGEDWLKATSERLNVSIQYTDVKIILNIKGKVGDQEAFQSELRNWSSKILHNNSLSNQNQAIEQPKNDQNYGIPKNRNTLLQHLNKSLQSLKTEIGDPNALHKEFTYLRNRHEQLLKQKIISPKQLSNNRCHMNDMLKKLNMILLGQAGLANGAQHLNELYTFQQKLMISKQKVITPEMRHEIGQHYHQIFTPVQRDDYIDLLKKYYKSDRTVNVKSNKKHEKPSKQKPIQKTEGVKLDIIPPLVHGKKQGNKNPNQMLTKLIYYHQKLHNARPEEPVLKKTKTDLIKKLYSYIASVLRNDNMTPKTVRRVKKTQERARLFLATD